jgi:hypothetical protein
VLRDQTVALGHEIVEGREARAVVEHAIGEERHLEPALVLEIVRLEELGWITGMDEHGHAEPARRLPYDVELGIVERETGSVRTARGEAEALHDLADAHRAGAHVLLELGCDSCARSRPHAVEVERCEEDEPVGVACLPHRLDLLPQTLSGARAGLHHHLDVERVHRVDDLTDRLR